MNEVGPSKQFTGPQMAQIYADDRDATEAAGDSAVGPRDRQAHLRKSARSTDSFGPILPREIEVHIEELVLHGYAPGDRWEIGDAVERELRTLLATKGIPARWLSGPKRLDAGAMPGFGLTNPSLTGAEIGAAVSRGGERR